MSIYPLAQTEPRGRALRGTASALPTVLTRGRVRTYAPQPVLLPDFTSARREAVRPLHARPPGFDGQFDDETLFFDAFRAPDNRHVVLIGPALFNLAAALKDLVVTDANGRRLPGVRLRHLDRQAQLWVEAPEHVRHLRLRCGLGSVLVPVGASLAPLFAGRRVLLTRSRNNPLPWVLDWVRFNRDVNGADAVLFYDNASTLYDLDALREAIGSVAGIRAVGVVHWPFKYGPQGPNAWEYWDSDFCELGAWEHARWRFLAQARSVLTGDVDELAFGTTRTPFEAAERSPFGVVRYSGRWIVGSQEDGGPEAALEGRRHRQFTTVLKRQKGRNRLGWPVDGARCGAKWTAVPARCPARAQWRMHTIRHWPQSYLTTQAVTFGHFRPINTSWKYDRDDGGSFDPALHERHDGLAAAMERVDWER